MGDSLYIKVKSESDQQRHYEIHTGNKKSQINLAHHDMSLGNYETKGYEAKASNISYGQ